MAIASTPLNYIVEQLVNPVWPDEMGQDQDSTNSEAPVLMYSFEKGSLSLQSSFDSCLGDFNTE